MLPVEAVTDSVGAFAQCMMADHLPWAPVLFCHWPSQVLQILKKQLVMLPFLLKVHFKTITILLSVRLFSCEKHSRRLQSFPGV